MSIALQILCVLIPNALPATLVLNFPDFYEFRGSINAMHNADFSGKFVGIQKTGSGSDFPDLPAIIINATGDDNSIKGTFYGPSSTNPTEAVGTWRLLENSTGKEFIVEGAFGVKK